MQRCPRLAWHARFCQSKQLLQHCIHCPAQLDQLWGLPTSNGYLGMLGDSRRQGPARGIFHHLLNETSAGSKVLLSSVPSAGFRVHTQTTLALQSELLQTGTHEMSKLNILVTPTAVFTKYIFKSGIFLSPQKRPALENS